MKTMINDAEFALLLQIWSDSISNFKLFLINCIGLNTCDSLYKDIVEVINSKDKLLTYLKYYDGGLDREDLDDAFNEMLKHEVVA